MWRAYNPYFFDKFDSRAFRAPVSSHRRLHNMDVVNIQITNWDPNKIEVMCV